MKPNLGKGIYYASVIITIVSLILVMILFTSKNYTDEEISVIRYIAAYFSFGVVLSLGVAFRELFCLEFNKTKMIIKFIVILLTAIGGVFIVIFLKSAKVGLFILFISIGVLLYSIIPTIKNNNFKG